MNDDDFFDQARNNKFVIVPVELLDHPTTGHVVLMSDPKFWADNVDECIAWCFQHNCQFEGMTIVIPDKQTLTHFILRWS